MSSHAEEQVFSCRSPSSTRRLNPSGNQRPGKNGNQARLPFNHLIELLLFTVSFFVFLQPLLSHSLWQFGFFSTQQFFSPQLSKHLIMNPQSTLELPFHLRSRGTTPPAPSSVPVIPYIRPGPLLPLMQVVGGSPPNQILLATRTFDLLSIFRCMLTRVYASQAKFQSHNTQKIRTPSQRIL